jgi:hypothetical protein
MNLTIDIKQDKELRDEIREMIHEQISQIVKEDITGLVHDTLLSYVTVGRIEKLMQIEISQSLKVRKAIKDQLPDAIDKAVTHIINRLTKFKES